MTSCESILDLSHNFAPDMVSPWIDDENVPMDVYTAASLGNYDIVRDFLKSDTEKVAINRCNKGGWNPLMYASYVGHESIVNLLLDFQVNVDTRTSTKAATALMLAASCGNEAVVYFLVQSGAGINAVDKNGYTALYYATLQGHQEVAKILIDHGSDTERRENINGFTPLLNAAHEGHEGIFNLILTAGANAEAKSKQGLDARQIAFTCGHMAIVNLLDLHGARHQPNAMLRSEPGLGGDDFFYHPEMASPDWAINHGRGSPGIGIKDGPQAFAWLRTHQNPQQLKHPCIPTVTPAVAIDIKQKKFPSQEMYPGTSSPLLIPQSPATGSYSNSYEDYFFAHSGGTVKSNSLNERLVKLELHENEVASPPQSLTSQPNTPEYPMISEFLDDLNLTKYLSIFEEQEVDFETLLTLSDADLKEIGITLFGPRRKITTATNSWKENQPRRKSHLRNLEMEVYELKLQLQNTMLQLHQEKELRNMVEGCVVDEKAKSQKATAQWNKTVSKIKQTFSELEEVTNIISHLCDKTNDDVTKELFMKLTSSLEKTAAALKGSVSLDCGRPHDNALSDSVHSKSG